MLISRNWNTKTEQIVDNNRLLDSTAKAKIDIHHFPTGKKINNTLKGSARMYFDTYQAIYDETVSDSVFVLSKTLKTKRIERGRAKKRDIEIRRMIKRIVDGD